MYCPVKEVLPCPCCDKSISTSDWMENWSHNDEEFVIECPHCGEELDFRVELTLDYVFIGDSK